MSKKNLEILADQILEDVGGKENISHMTHCMTRLRLNLKDESLAKDDEIKRLKGISGIAKAGGQYQIIIGPEVTSLYDAMTERLPEFGKNLNNRIEIKEKVSLTPKNILNQIMGALAGCMTPLIPILLCSGFSKAIVAIIGPTALNLVSDKSNIYILFSFVGDAGFYFLPIFAGYTAAKKFKTSPILGMLLGSIMVHPTLLKMVADGGKFDVYGIPVALQNYTSSVIPIILSVWIMSYVERFFKDKTPATLKVFGVPFGTLLVMLPLTLCLFGPAGALIGNYVGNGLIALHNVAGPLAVAVVAAIFGLLVMTGMHPVLFAFLFVSFPEIGYDAFIIPAMIISAYAGAGVAIACIIKIKDKEKKSLVMGYLLTWFLGGVGEPMLYGLNIPFKTPLYASIASGFIGGLVGGLLGLKAYILNTANGIYGLAGFLGGPTSNLVVLAISLIVSVIAGFIIMWFMKLDETLVDL